MAIINTSNHKRKEGGETKLDLFSYLSATSTRSFSSLFAPSIIRARASPKPTEQFGQGCRKSSTVLIPSYWGSSSCIVWVIAEGPFPQAVLVKSEAMPEGSRTVRGWDFCHGSDLDGIMEAMLTSGFQATALGQAVQEVNNMVSDGTMSQHPSSTNPPLSHCLLIRIQSAASHLASLFYAPPLSFPSLSRFARCSVRLLRRTRLMPPSHPDKMAP